MELIFKFFDKEEWSMYATINVFIPLILLILFKQKLTVSVLILVSLMAMMKGNLLSKILFVGFLNFLLYERSVNWIIRSCIFVFSIILMHHVPYNHFFHKLVLKNMFLFYAFVLMIILWMSYIFYLIFTKKNSIL